MAKVRLTTEEIKNEMILCTDGEGRNAWHIAAFSDEVDEMQRLWELAKKRLKTEDIRNEMLLGTDGWRRNFWQIAAYSGKLDVMQRLWDLAKVRLTTEEIKMKCYYAQTKREGSSGN